MRIGAGRDVRVSAVEDGVFPGQILAGGEFSEELQRSNDAYFFLQFALSRLEIIFACREMSRSRRRIAVREFVLRGRANLDEQLVTAIEDEYVRRAVQQLSRMHLRSRRLSNDPVLKITDVKDFFGHGALHKERAS